jgi:flagellar hook-length control protein FliK
MNPTTNQIFDLLLGNFSGANGATAGRSLNGESGELFNELLAGLLGDGGDVLAQLSGPNDPQAGMNLVESINRGNGKPDDLGAFVEQIADRQGPAKELFNHATRAGLPISEYSLTRFSELQPGTYSIIEADSSNGQLHLALESAGGEQLKLTLPADAFAEKTTSADVSDSKVNLDKLFEKLNLKEMVIEKSAPEINKEVNAGQKQTTSVKLISEDKSSELVLRSKIDIQSTPVVIEKPVMQALSGELQFRDFRSGRGTNSSKVVESILSSRFDISTIDSFAKIDPTEPTLSKSNSADGFDRALNSHSSNGNDIKSPELAEFKATQMARFTLPDNLSQMLRPNGRSLTLQIEPEHLGKARIHLAMKSDGLTARVVVDSEIARQAVEVGMGRLLDQLSKAHINVDSIDVSVGGNSDDSGQLAQHRFFSNRPRMAFNKSLENETLESAALVAAAHQLYGGGMISRSGVNVLA